MNRRTTLLLAFLAIVGPVSTAGAQDTQAYKELLTQQERLDKAKDYRSYGSFLAPTFTMTAPDGTVVTRAQALAEYKEGQTSKDLPKFKPAPRRIDSLSIQGNEGVVLVSSTAIYKQKDTPGTFGPKGQEHEWNIAQTNRYTWIRTARGWKLNSIANVGVKRLIDGKPYPPPAPEPSSASPESSAPAKP